MKKLSKFLVSATLMVAMIFGVNTVKAFELSSVSLSSDINFPWFIYDGVIEITLGGTLKDNNPTINYQFVAISEPELNEIMSIHDTIKSNYNTCTDAAKTQYDYITIREQLIAEGKNYYLDETYRTISGRKRPKDKDIYRGRGRVEL